MPLRVEWRTQGNMNDTLLVLDDEQQKVRRALDPNPNMLRDFLTDIADMEALKAERNRASESIGQAKRRGENPEPVMARMREVGDRIKALDADVKRVDEQSRREILHIRHHSLYAPRDFDVSPFFAIIKPTIETGFDYKKMTWALDDPPANEEQRRNTTA